MDATPIDFAGSERLTPEALDGSRPVLEPGFVGDMLARWTALHEAARVVASLAGDADPAAAAPPPGSGEALAASTGTRQFLAEQAIGDICAFLESGLTALLTIHGRGDDPAAPARALWQEFDEARTALLALVSPGRS